MLPFNAGKPNEQNEETHTFNANDRSMNGTILKYLSVVYNRKEMKKSKRYMINSFFLKYNLRIIQPTLNNFNQYLTINNLAALTRA